jgi:Spy/CpxP family protein refolding chaperone
MRHNTWGWIGLTSLVLACAGGTVRAQTAGGGQAPAAGQARQGRQGGGPVYLSDLSVETMSQGLKLTDDQKTKIQAILDKRAADYKTLVLPGDQQGKADAVQEANRKRGEFAQKADTDIEAVLTDEQKKVLPDYKKELAFFRQAGLPAGLIGDMKITDEQRTKIGAQATENRRTMRQKMRDAQQSGTAITPEARRAMTKENQDKILALLTPEQRAMLDKYNKDHPTPVPGNPANADAKPNAQAGNNN